MKKGGESRLEPLYRDDGLLNLHASDPLMLTTCATPAELLAAIRALETWDVESLDATNLLLCVWAGRAIASPNDREGITELQRLIGHTIGWAKSRETLPKEYQHRWNQMSDLLEGRRMILAHADPESQMKRPHVSEMFRFMLESGNAEVRQSDIREFLGVSERRMVGLIGPLEAHGLITKRKVGLDQLLRLTEVGKEYARQENEKMEET